MAVGYDATSVATQGTGNLSFTHTPSGTPRGVVVLVSQGGTITDEVSGVTYGGVAMARIQFVTRTSADIPEAVYIYFLGAGVPTGAQTVVVTVSGATLKQAVAATQTAGADCEVDTSAGVTGLLTNPSIVLATTAGMTTAVYGVAHISEAAALVSVAAGCTEIHESNGTGANDVNSMLRLTALGTGGNQTVGWTYNNDQIAAAAVAVREAVAPGPQFRSLVPIPFM